MDLQNKKSWCEIGGKLEQDFITEIAPGLGLPLIIHPEKKQNPYVADLYNTQTDCPAELKTRLTPFFTAADYGLDPQFAVTFNQKDYVHYVKNWKVLEIYFWIAWKKRFFQGLNRVLFMYGVWKTNFEMIQALIEIEKAPLHHYQQRQHDQRHNAKSSYLFDLRRFERLL
jgi:hypothetical protein